MAKTFPGDHPAPRVWAFAYNLATIPLAATGVLSPAACGISMALSSVGVLGNSLRLSRFSGS